MDIKANWSKIHQLYNRDCFNGWWGENKCSSSMRWSNGRFHKVGSFVDGKHYVFTKLHEALACESQIELEYLMAIKEA